MRLPRFAPTLLAAALLAASAAQTPVDSAAATAKPAVVKVPKHGAIPAAVPFIDDDLTKALALAKQSKRPVFIEAWAPW